MITLISTPAYPSPGSPDTAEQWLATESPNNFRLQRKDWIVSSVAAAASPSISVITVGSDFTGNVNDDIAFYSAYHGVMYTGKVLTIDVGLRDITTDIDYDAAFTTGYLNDNTKYGGYYFEGQLKINGVLQTLTVIASPDLKGIADLDVSGILRITTQIGKIGNNLLTTVLTAETGKSGNFTFKYRECWYGSSELYTEEGNTWYYCEAVRSEEQGSNLHEFVPGIDPAPFFNSFERPVYFLGLPFDLSFIVPDTTDTTLTVVINRYDSTHTLLGYTSVPVNVASLKGFLCSLNIAFASIEATVSYLTIEITSA